MIESIQIQQTLILIKCVLLDIIHAFSDINILFYYSYIPYGIVSMFSLITRVSKTIIYPLHSTRDNNALCPLSQHIL